MPESFPAVTLINPSRPKPRGTQEGPREVTQPESLLQAGFRLEAFAAKPLLSPAPKEAKERECNKGMTH